MSLPSETQRSRTGNFVDALAVYLRPRVLIVLLLGFSAGLPLALSGETLRVWMADRWGSSPINPRFSLAAWISERR